MAKSQEFREGLVEAHRLLTIESRKAAKEWTRSAALLGGLMPSRQQIESQGAIKALASLSTRIVEAAELNDADQAD